MPARRIAPARTPPRITVRAVPSKSDTHRALVAAALAGGPVAVLSPLVADDTCRTRDGLRALGFRVDDAPGCWTVHGLGGRVPGGGHIELGASGTSCRFLLALAALGERPTRLDGAPRLRERPIEPLIEALRGLGARVETAAATRRWPLVAGGRPPRGGAAILHAPPSSQFASGLLLIGSALPEGLRLRVTGDVVSSSYVDMTIDTLRSLGGRVTRRGPADFEVVPTRLTARAYAVEGDHSAASYFLAAPAVIGAGTVRVDGLRPDSRQPDAMLGRLLETRGARVGRGATWVEVQARGPVEAFDLDLSQAPDLAPTVAVVAAFADGPSTLRGLVHLRVKETDRLESLAANLRRLGAGAAVRGTTLVVDPRSSAVAIDEPITTGSDHRIAMAFAVAGLGVPGVVIDDAACVSKSNPAFWHEFARLEGPQNW